MHLTECPTHKDISSYKCQLQENKVWQLSEEKIWQMETEFGGGGGGNYFVKPNLG